MQKVFLALAVITLLAASCSLTSKANVGIVKTANGGVDWQPANKINNSEQTLLQKSISQLKFNPSWDKLFASSFNGGLYSSDDAGENWTEVLGGVLIYDFVFDPNDEKVIYAAVFMGERGRVLLTRDGGKSWKEVYSDAAKKNPVRAVALNPDNSNEVYIGTNKGLLIYSANNGESWQLLETFSDRVNSLYWGERGLYALVKSKGLFFSDNNGRSFENLTERLRVPKTTKSYLTSSGKVSDFRQFAISPQDSAIIYLTTSKGLFSSRDGGNSWDYVSMPYRQQDAMPFAVAIAPSSPDVVYVSSNSVVLKTTDGGSNWSASDTGTKGLVSVLLVSRDLPQIAFAGVSE